MTLEFDAVIFDCDGVLVDSEHSNNEILAALVTRAGIPVTPADSAARYMGRSTPECVADVERELGRPVSFDLTAEYEALAREHQRHSLKTVPGVGKLLDVFQLRGILVCVASSGSSKEIRWKLAHTNLTGFFGEHCYSASMVARGKPAPDLFLFAAKKLGVDPGRCVVVEDSIPGVRAGKAAGMTVIGFAALTPARALTDVGADYVFSSMTDVLSLLA